MKTKLKPIKKMNKAQARVAIAAQIPCISEIYFQNQTTGCSPSFATSSLTTAP